MSRNSCCKQSDSCCFHVIQSASAKATFIDRNGFKFHASLRKASHEDLKTIPYESTCTTIHNTVMLMLEAEFVKE